jgi:hypothetical protein
MYGCGGGGSGGTFSGATGGAGKAGVVIVRYLASSTLSATGGQETKTV